MKYCILKGSEGFGDRLRCLLYAIQYCELTNRTLVIDWRDRDWTQGRDVPIEEYFKIKKIKNIPYHIFLKKCIKEEFSIFPPKWKDVLFARGFESWLGGREFLVNERKIMFKEIVEDGAEDFNESVVVYSGVGYRFDRRKYTKYIDFSKKVKNNISLALNQYKIKKNKYICIHLRFESKSWDNNEKIVNKRIKSQIENKFPTKKNYFEYMEKELSEINEKLKVIIITDNYEEAEKWNKENKIGEVVKHQTKIEAKEKSGIHKANINFENSNYNINTKHEMNMDCLRDFGLMLNSKYLISDKISTFSNIARKFRLNDKS